MWSVFEDRTWPCSRLRGHLLDSGQLYHAGLVALAWLSIGALWEVNWDPENHTDQVGRVIAETGAGDTVLVGPGVYFEHIPIPPHPLVLLSSEGPTGTTLDGSVPIEGRQGSIVYALEAHLPALTITGFTFRGGTGSVIPDIHLAGGAIALQACESCPAEIAIRNCMFEGNAAVSGWHGRGGALYIDGDAVRATVTDCVFRNNRAVSFGAHVGLHWGRAVFLRCEFDTRGEPALTGQAIRAHHTAHLRLEDCTILGGDNLVYSYSIFTITNLVELIGNRLLDQGVPSATYVNLDRYEICCSYQEVVLRDNVFIGSEGPSDVPRVRIGPEEGRVTVEGNTFVDAKVSISVNSGSDLQFTRNIVKRTPVDIVYGPGGMFGCNNIWPDSTSVRILCCDVEREHNISTDPLFCGEATGDYRIAAESPCAAGNAPAGCGQIGALGIGCSQTPVERLSWGKVKHLFR